MSGGPLFVTRFPTPHGFLEGAGHFLVENEVENNLILGITRDLTVDPSGLMPDPYFGVVCRGDEVVMAAFQTIPGKLALTRETTPDAVAALARDLHRARRRIDGILGPEEAVERFARELGSLCGRHYQLRMRQRIHELTGVNPGRMPPGVLRSLGPDELPLLVDWLTAFHAEIGEPPPMNRTAEMRLAAGEIMFWDDGRPVSMAGSSGKTPNGIRVNAVYTPPEFRGRGYATATVSALSQLLLDQGNRFCCLYTDLANPTSNAIYRRIGYEPVSDCAVFVLRRDAET